MLQSYKFFPSGLGVFNNSLARLMYSHGSPVESTLSSRPTMGNSLGLCRDVKLVSRHSLCGGVSPSKPSGLYIGVDGDNSACRSASHSTPMTSRPSLDSDGSTDDAWHEVIRCGFTGPKVVTT